MNVPVLDAAADGHGSFSIKAGADEITRLLPMIALVGDRLVPSLALEALRVLQDEDTFKVRAERVGETLTGYTVRVGDIDVPLNADGSLRLRFPAARSSRTVSAWRLLDADHRAELRDRGEGGSRVRRHQRGRPVRLAADTDDPIRAGRRSTRHRLGTSFDRQASRPSGLGIRGRTQRWRYSLGSRLRLPALLTPFGVAALMAASMIVVPNLIAWAAFTRANLLFDPTLPSLSLAVGFAGAILVRYAGTERASRRLRAAFTHYLSPDLVAALAKRSRPAQARRRVPRDDVPVHRPRRVHRHDRGGRCRGARAAVERLPRRDVFDRDGARRHSRQDRRRCSARHVQRAPRSTRSPRACRAVRTRARYLRGSLQASPARSWDRIRHHADRGEHRESRSSEISAGRGASTTPLTETPSTPRHGSRRPTRPSGHGICIARATVERVSTHVFRPVGTLMLKGKSVGVDVFEPATQPTGALANYLDAFGRMIAGDAGALQDLLSLHAADPKRSDPRTARTPHQSRRVRCAYGRLKTRHRQPRTRRTASATFVT